MFLYPYSTTATPDSELSLNVRMSGTDDVVVAEAELWIDGQELYVARSSSRRDPKDTSNSETGVKLAVGRAIRQLGREVLKDGQDLVREAEAKRQKQLAAARIAKQAKNARAATKPQCSCGVVGCNYESLFGR